MNRKNLPRILFVLMLLSVLCIGLVNHQESENEGLAIVKKRQGIEVYVMCDPVRDYEIVGEVAAVDAAGVINILAGEEKQQSIVEQVDILLKNAKRKVKKEKIPEFDALMTDEGDIGQLIKFTD